MLGALAISVPEVHRSKGYARLMIRSLIDLSEAKGLRGLVAPVRPSAKVEHPWVPIMDYIGWTDQRGRVYEEPSFRRRQAHRSLRTIDGRA
jgi:hypothetical protein